MRQRLLPFGGATLGPGPAYGSVLDTVLADLGSLQKRLGASDRARLEAYATQVRAIETNLQGAAGACVRPADVGADSASIDSVANLTQRANAFWALIASALACDLTRVVSVQYSGGVGGTQVPDELYSKTPIYKNGSDKPLRNDVNHSLTHDESTYSQPAVATFSAFYQGQFSNLLQKMVATPDGTGNLLDNSAVMVTTEVAEGRRHREMHIPILVAGRARGRLVGTGIHYAGNAGKGRGGVAGTSPANEWLDDGDCNTSDNNAMNPTDVHLTLLRAMGSTRQSYGLKEAASSTTIPELLA